MKHWHVQASKFVVVGAINFFLTLAVFTAALKLFVLNYAVALGSAWVVGNVFSYVCNFRWIFKPEEKLRFNAGIIKYFTASLASLVLNMCLLGFLVESRGYDPFWSQMGLIPLIVVINFTAAKYWSLR